MHLCVCVCLCKHVVGGAEVNVVCLLKSLSVLGQTLSLNLLLIDLRRLAHSGILLFPTSSVLGLQMCAPTLDFSCCCACVVSTLVT